MISSIRIEWILFVLVTLGICPIALGEDERFEANGDYIREHYTKFEYQIPMRDGVRLMTSVYVPKDESEKYPIWLRRTPYGMKPYGVDNVREEPSGPLKFYSNERFIFAFQDVRGRNGSEGEFEHVRPHNPDKSGKEIDESTDTYDTIDWLIKNVNNNNGKVGLSGISYPGFYSAAGMIDAHPALKCVSPQAPVTDWFVGDDFRHNGAFYLAHAFHFLSRFGQPLKKPTRQSPVAYDYQTPDGYEFYLKFGRLVDAEKNHGIEKMRYWDKLVRHDTYDDFWRARNILPHLKNIKPAVMTVGGWYDAEDLYGPLNVYQATERNSPGATNMLVMGPWAHGGWHRVDGDHLGQVEFHQKTSHFFRDEIELPFFNHYLKGTPKPDLPEAFVFETGTDQWRRHESWPPKNAESTALYFLEDGQLSFSPPKTTGNTRFDEYVSDPQKPVPATPNIAIGMTKEHMVDDQRFASTRTDVLVYQSEPLQEDVTIAGSIDPHLFVSTSGTDSDWVVKLIDVYHGDFPDPDPNPTGVRMGGYQQLVRGEAFRGKFRNSFERPEPFEPNVVAEVSYTMPDAFHTFRRGHRIMVQIQSTWFPLIDRNPHKFMKIAEANPSDYQKATQRVYRSKEQPSHIVVKVLHP